MQLHMILKQLCMEGFVVARWENRREEGLKQLLKWVVEVRVRGDGKLCCVPFRSAISKGRWLHPAKSSLAWLMLTVPPGNPCKSPTAPPKSLHGQLLPDSAAPAGCEPRFPDRHRWVLQILGPAAGTL